MVTSQNQLPASICYCFSWDILHRRTHTHTHLHPSSQYFDVQLMLTSLSLLLCLALSCLRDGKALARAKKLILEGAELVRQAFRLLNF